MSQFDHSDLTSKLTEYAATLGWDLSDWTSLDTWTDGTAQIELWAQPLPICGEVGTSFPNGSYEPLAHTEPCALPPDHEEDHSWAQREAAEERVSRALRMYEELTAAKPGDVLTEVAEERARQDAKWGQQNHPDGTHQKWQVVADGMRAKVESKAARGALTFRDILEEEIWEAYAETDPAKLRAELIQVVAVGVAWIEAIDRRAEAGR